MQMQTPTNKVAVQKLLIKSRIETDTLKERELLCPECGFRIQTIYSDASGHLRVKCPKCKGIYVLNLAYFRRIQRRNKHKRRVLDRYHK